MPAWGSGGLSGRGLLHRDMGVGTEPFSVSDNSMALPFALPLLRDVFSSPLHPVFVFVGKIDKWFQLLHSGANGRRAGWRLRSAGPHGVLLEEVASEQSPEEVCREPQGSMGGAASAGPPQSPVGV